ncbi:MAG: hypothetical protein AAF108_01410 [Planctomycetota bacterium]
MPPLPPIQTEPMRELLSQLRYARREAVVLDIERAESLLSELEPDGVYPAEYLVFRITGHRDGGAIDFDAGGTAVGMMRGEVMIADLPVLVEHLSQAVGLKRSEVAGALLADELAERWSVTRKTLSRYRKLGLTPLRVVWDDGRTRTAYRASTVASFEERHGDRVEKAGAFERLGEADEARALRWARGYSERLEWSLNQAAERVGARLGRSREAIRQLLMRHDERSETAEMLFDERGPASAAEVEQAYEAWRRGAEPGQLAETLRSSVASARRSVNARRAAVLRRFEPELVAGLDIEKPELIELARIGPDESLALGFSSEETLGAFFGDVRSMSPPDAGLEARRARSFLALRVRAAAAIRGLPAAGVSPTVLDRVETDLRWASRLHAELVRSQLSTALRAAVGRLGEEPEWFGTSAAVSIAGAMIAGATAGALRFDPLTRGRLAAPVTLSVDRRVRELGASVARPSEGRARKAFDGSTRLKDWTLRLTPWQKAVDLSKGARARLGGMDAHLRRVLIARYGLALATEGGLEGGEHPLTLAELAQREGRAVLHLARTERAAVRRAVGGEARAGTGPGLAVETVQRAVSRAGPETRSPDGAEVPSPDG